MMLYTCEAWCTEVLTTGSRLLISGLRSSNIIFRDEDVPLASSPAILVNNQSRTVAPVINARCVFSASHMPAADMRHSTCM